MSDPGTIATDAAQAALERQMRKVYSQAQEEIIEKLNAHLKKFMAMDVKKRAQLAAGTLTKEDYEHWLNGQVFIGKQWQDKVTSVAATLMDANKQANDMIEGKKRAVFGENASFQAYKLEHDAGMDLSFSVYDSATVTKLLNERPELLPRKVVNGVKDQAWNRRKIANAVMQGIIQGEAIDEIADRIARQTGSQNMNAMTRYARTAMTGAQNAGRMETMHEAQDMGIKVKKKWIATLDSRTRDAHADLDGQVQEVDKPFDSELGKIMYPGDITADPANVWNCRCTLGYVYDEYPERYAQRRAYVEYVDDNGEYHRESHEIANMSYRVWKLAKDRDNRRALDAWRASNIVTNGNTVGKSVIGSLQKRIKRNKVQLLADATKMPEETAEAVKRLKKINGNHTRLEDCQKTNPNYFNGKEWENNCQRCCAAFEARRRGFDVTSQPLFGEPIFDEYARGVMGFTKFYQRGDRVPENIYRRLGLNRNGLTLDQIKEGIGTIMNEYGNGSRAVILGYWDITGEGHVFVAENIGGIVHFYNPQSGDMNYLRPFEAMETASMRIFRIDDLPFSEDIEKAVKNCD